MKGLSESTRDAPPSHFIFEIKSFSKLASSSLERYESCVFDTSVYKWKLVVYPNGNKRKDGEDHISLYLVPADDRSGFGSVTFSLFVFDHIRKKYVYAHGVSDNYANKSNMGFDKFLPLKTFIDPSNGYLVDDNCMFGAEVFLIENYVKRQCLTMTMRKPYPFRFTWEVQKFSTLGERTQYSKVFTTRGHDFELSLNPKGGGSESGRSLSLFLRLADSKTPLPEGKDVVVKKKLCIVDQLNGNHKEKECISIFNSTNRSWGSNKFLSLKDLNQSTGYLVDDTCIIEAEVIVIGSTHMLKS